MRPLTPNPLTSAQVNANMEHPASELRTTSFNPEAAAFSPVFASKPPQDVDLAPATPQTLPPVSDFTFEMAPMFNYSPFHDLGSTRSLYRRDSLAPAPVRLEQFLSLEVRALVKKLEEHPNVQEIQAPQRPSAKVAQSPTRSLPPFTFPAPVSQPQPDYTKVGINELSSGLGLPTAKAEDIEDVSTVASHKSLTSQAHPGALYGKLIGWALDKPLTAKGLAEFLQEQDTSIPFKPSALPSVSPAKTPKTKTNPTKSESPATHRTRKSSLRLTAAPVPAEANVVQNGHSAQHQHHRSSTSTASYRQHTRAPSHRRYPRRSSRAKRMDQGPMPSSADIYPEDFHFPPPIYETTTTNPSQPAHPDTIISNPFNWPPPAQVYAPEPPPSLADMLAADTDVLALVAELPEPSLCTLAKLGNTHDLRATSGLDLPCDERALTPAQEDGSRYGIRYFGLAYGDSWEVGGVGEGEAFRVRPREHEGWGGWQWALGRGWKG